MDGIFNSLAASLGASVDQIKLITCLLVSYPLGSIFVRIPSAGLKHAFCIFVTLFYLLGLLSMFNAFFQLMLDILVTYYLSKGMTDKRMPWIVFIFVMGHLLINHIIRSFFNLSYETMEVTGPQMVLVMKLTTFAWNVHDGRRPVEELDKWQLERRVTDQKFPSLLAFLGYSFYFPGFFVGPFLEYAEYDALVTERLFKSASPPKHQETNLIPRRLLPSGRKRVGYFKLVTGLVYLGLFVVLNGKFSFAQTLKPWFGRITLAERLLFFQMAGFFERCKYYAVWTLTEGAAILTGLGFSGYNEEGGTLWEGAANIRVLNIEFAENFKMLLDSWNMKTNVWLRECIYKRVTKKGAKPGFKSSMMTFTVSAIWHGVSPGYYLTFVFGGFVTTAARLVRSSVRPLFIPVPGQPVTTPPSFNKRIYDWLGIVLTAMIMNYAAAPFMLLTVEDSLECFSRVAWYGYFIIGGSLLFFYGGGTRTLKKAQAKRIKNYQDQVAAEREREKEMDESVNGTAYETESGITTPSSDETHVVPPIALVAKELERHHEKAL